MPTYGNLGVVPSTLEVDYDKNLTELYQAITDQKWDRAAHIAKKHPVQAATWVVRHYEDDNEIMWRFLPIHSACARQPPAFVIQALLKAYPDGAKCVDDQGMYPLHYACGNQASRDVIRMLLVNFPEAAKLPDPRGMLPIHYLACWGPSSVNVVDMLMVAHRDVAACRDEEGNTPLDLAREGDYPERAAVMATLKKWMDDDAGGKKVAFDGEEKKEDHEIISRIQHIRKQANDTRNTEARHEEHYWKKKFQDLDKKYIEREKELLMENGELTDLIHEMKQDLKASKSLLEGQGSSTVLKDEKIKYLEEQLENSRFERDGLRATLGDLMEQHDAFKKKAHQLSDRLGSLSVSLESMMDQQKSLSRSMHERNEQYQRVIQQRQVKLMELEELERSMAKDESMLESSLEKQMKEMEAIAAVIAATRD
jgi:hypothetical protein